jgi:hypothetical protein
VDYTNFIDYFENTRHQERTRKISKFAVEQSVELIEESVKSEVAKEEVMSCILLLAEKIEKSSQFDVGKYKVSLFKYKKRVIATIFKNDKVSGQVTLSEDDFVVNCPLYQDGDIADHAVGVFLKKGQT